MVEGKVIKSLFSKHQWVHIDFFVKEIFEKQLLLGTSNVLKPDLIVISFSIFLMVLFISTNVLLANFLFTNIALCSITQIPWQVF